MVSRPYCIIAGTTQALVLSRVAGGAGSRGGRGGGWGAHVPGLPCQPGGRPAHAAGLEHAPDTKKAHMHAKQFDVPR